LAKLRQKKENAELTVQLGKRAGATHQYDRNNALERMTDELRSDIPMLPKNRQRAKTIEADAKWLCKAYLWGVAGRAWGVWRTSELNLGEGQRYGGGNITRLLCRKGLGF